MNETKLNGQSADIVSENIQKLKEIFPEVFCEDKIDFKKLQSVLGKYTDDDNERYNFTWWGKSRALRLAQTPSMGTLRPCKEESKDWDKTKNLYIEGDNLEVLKLLQKSYHGKVKMIYIDPPYNTGKDFIYPDDYRDPLKNYLAMTEQVDEEGKKISTNSEASGRFHTNWLNMMYPRLRLARNLLRDDGIMFISIDDNEVENLKKVCNELFGEGNFEGHIHWRRRHNQPNDKTKMIGLVAEHILAYAKSSEKLKEKGVGKIDLTGNFSNPDNDPRGYWASKPWKVGSDQSGSRYIITSPTGRVFDEEWMGEESTFNSLLADGRILFTNNGNGFPRKKYYKSEREEEGQCATNWWSHEDFGHNQGANNLLTELFGEKNLFSNPKPVELMEGLLQISNAKNDDLVIDFFAGASTTAHSILDFNIKSNSDIRFLMIQYPENLNDMLKNASSEQKKNLKKSIEFLNGLGQPQFITELGKERIRRAGEKIKSELRKKQTNQLSMLEENKIIHPDDLDIGFKVFKLDTSNLKKWNPDVDNLEESLLDAIENYVDGRSELDVVYEVMLKYGKDLTLPLEEYEVGGKKIYSVDYGALMICLDHDITTEVANEIVRLKEKLNPEVMRVVFKDNGFKDDSVKTNTKEILRNAGIDEIVSV